MKYNSRKYDSLQDIYNRLREGGVSHEKFVSLHGINLDIGLELLTKYKIFYSSRVLPKEKRESSEPKRDDVEVFD